jgi:Cu(I)/Ag(I) efflux system membrane fusion protein
MNTGGTAISLHETSGSSAVARVGIASSALLVLLALLSVGCARSPDMPPATEPADAAANDTPAEHAARHMNPKYRCPMHPDVVRDKPGECPVCGMALVKIEPETATATASTASPGVRISPEVINNLGVRTEPAVRGTLPRRAETVGYVGFDERQVQQVRPRAEGWVEGLKVRSMGEAVRAGQVLFTLYSPMLESAQQEYLDALKIGNRDLIEASRQRLGALGLDSGTAGRISKAGRASGRVPYVAPISGVVTELELKEGSMITPEMMAMTITGIGSLWVIAEVPEAQAGWIVAGTAAEMRFPSLPGEPVTGRVEYVYPELDMETRTLRARITLDGATVAVRPNMLASVSLIGASGPEVVSIPRSALIRSGTDERVVVALGDGRFAPRRVVAGAESGERVVIREGLAAGENVVVAGQFLLDSEANLRAGLGRLGEESPAPPATAPQGAQH